MDLNKLAQDAKESIIFSDSPEAYKLLGLFADFLHTYDIKSNDPPLFQNLQKMISSLKIVAFPNLPDQESEDILQHHYLESFNIDFSMENAITEKLFILPYGERKELSESLKKAFLQNSQSLGSLTVGQWLQAFDKSFDAKTRNQSAIVRFLAENGFAQQLNLGDKEKLKKTLHIYDSLLIYTPFAVDPDESLLYRTFVREISTRPNLGETANTTHEPDYRSEESSENAHASEQLGIRGALSKYPKLGEQTVTASAIKLKQFDQPVRPSVRNWLYDYTSHLGQTGHSSMDRTTYLFRSDNAKILSSPEREKLAIILKSFDENTPLPIDGDRQEIVFESFVRKQTPPPPPPLIRGGNIRGSSAPSINFIHHIDRPSVSSASAERNVASVPKQQFPPLQKQEISFVRPYPEPILSSAPPVPPRKEVSLPIQKQPSVAMEFTNPYPKPGTHETQFEKKNDNISNVRFSEGAPKNSFTPISQVSAKKILTMQPSSPPVISMRPPAPIQRPTPTSASPVKPAAYRFTPPERNMIRPHYGRMTGENQSEPKIDGNIVDLKGDK